MSTEGNFLKWGRTELTTWISHQQTRLSGDVGELEITSALAVAISLAFLPHHLSPKQPPSLPRFPPNNAPKRHLTSDRCRPGLAAL